MGKEKTYINSIYLITSFFTLLVGMYFYSVIKNITISIITAIILYIPLSEIVIQLINYILSKRVKPTLIPKLDFSNRHSKGMCYICSNTYYCKF